MGGGEACWFRFGSDPGQISSYVATQSYSEMSNPGTGRNIEGETRPTNAK